VVYGDSDCTSECGSETSSLDFGQSKSTSEACLGRVSLSLTAYYRAKSLKRTGGNGCGLGSTLHTTGLLLLCLVEGKLHLEGTSGGVMPLLFAMDVGDLIVVLNHFELKENRDKALDSLRR